MTIQKIVRKRSVKLFIAGSQQKIVAAGMQRNAFFFPLLVCLFVSGNSSPRARCSLRRSCLPLSTRSPFAEIEMLNEIDEQTYQAKEGAAQTTTNGGDQYRQEGKETPASINEDSKYTDEPHVIVVGGGPAGLLTAILLRQRGIRVSVLEKLPVQDKWSIRSYSINLNSRGRNALLKAGVLDEVMKVATPRDEIAVHDGLTGKITTIIPKFPPDIAVSRPGLSMTLENVLLNEYQTEVRRGAKLKDMVLNRDDDRVELLLEDGSSIIGTHVVGADGKWSAVRESVPYFSQQALLKTEPSWGVHMTSPTLPTNWNKTSALIYRPRPEAKFYIICAPLPSGECSLTMVCFDETLQLYPWLEPPDENLRSWTSQQYKESNSPGGIKGVSGVALADKLEELFQAEVPAFLESVGKETLKSATINSRVSWLDMNMFRNEESRDNLHVGGGTATRQDSFVPGDARFSTPGGGIALVGDSCHCCTASLGQGCNLALESAVALGDAIDELVPRSLERKISIDELSEAFSSYGSSRPETARPVQAASSAASKFSMKW